MGAAWLQVARLGWKWEEPTKIVDHTGEMLILTQWSPRWIQKRCITRHNEMLGHNMAKKIDPECADTMLVDPGPLQSWLRSKEGKQCNQGVVKSTFVGAVWTTQRLCSAGYDIDDRCCLCGMVGVDCI